MSFRPSTRLLNDLSTERFFDLCYVRAPLGRAVRAYHGGHNRGDADTRARQAIGGQENVGIIPQRGGRSRFRGVQIPL